MADSEQPDTKI